MYFIYHNEQTKLEVERFWVAYIGHGHKFIEIPLLCDVQCLNA